MPDEKEDKNNGKKEEKDTKRVVPKTVEVEEETKAPKPEEDTKVLSEQKSFTDLKSPDLKKRKFPWVIVILTLVFATAGGIGGYFAYQKGVENGKKQAETPAPTAVSSPTPTASSAAELKRSDLSLEVLNGTGESGLASEAKTFLEDKGYVVDNIDNAKVFGAAETQISIKDSKKGYIDLLKNDLSEKYPIASDSTGLSEDSQYDVVITIGH